MSEPARRLTGRWAGAYRQHDTTGPIEAEVSVDDEGRLTGTMRDLVTDQEMSLFEATASAGLPPGTDERIEAALRAAFPDRAGGPIRFVSHLPPDSDLEGRVDDDRVRFVKTYRGASRSGYRIGDEVVVGGEIPRHAVHYLGRVEPDGRSIEGRWWIEADAARHVARAEGSFHLRRAD